MKLKIENFCSIKKSTVIEPKPLTIFCGKNNTGKTYSLYMLNALMDSRLQTSFEISKQYAKKLFEDRVLKVPAACLAGADALELAQKNMALSLQKMLPRFFAAENDFAENSLISLEIEAKTNFDFTLQRRGNDNKTWFKFVVDAGEAIFSLDEEARFPHDVENSINTALSAFYSPNTHGRNFLLPAERSGLNLFFRELNSQRAALLRHAASSTLDTAAILKDIFVSRYPRPIHDYIEFMNSQPEIKKQKSEFSDLAVWLQKEVLKVKYKVDRYGDISIEPARTGASLGLHMGSSTVKTFFGLWSYLNHLARTGDWVMIDEPELNLHPENQMLIARLIAQMVNRGINVVVSTHSDYMVREWGNLIMLGERNFKGRDALMKKQNISVAECMKPEQVSAYEFMQDSARSMSISGDLGIQATLFDQSIQDLNMRTEAIYFARQEALSAEAMND